MASTLLTFKTDTAPLVPGKLSVILDHSDKVLEKYMISDLNCFLSSCVANEAIDGKGQKSNERTQMPNSLFLNEMTSDMKFDHDEETFSSQKFAADIDDVLQEAPLRKMSKEQLISHYLKVVSMLKREKEILVHEKTEEIFQLKRQFMKVINNWRTEDALKKQLNYFGSVLNECKGREEMMSQGKCAPGRLQACSLSSERSSEGRDKPNILQRSAVGSKIMCEKNESYSSLIGSHLLQPTLDLNDVIEQTETQKAYEVEIFELCLEETLKDQFASTCLQQKNLEETVTEEQNEKIVHKGHHGFNEKVSMFELEKQCPELKHLYEIGIERVYLQETVKDQTVFLSLASKARSKLMEEKCLPEDIVTVKDDTSCINMQANPLMVLKMETREFIEQKENAEFNNTFATSVLSLCLEEAIKDQNVSLNKANAKCTELLKQKLLLENVLVERNNALTVSIKERESQKNKILLLEKQLEESNDINEKKESFLHKLMMEQEKLKIQVVLLEAVTNENKIFRDSLEEKSKSLEEALAWVEEEKQQKQFLEAKAQMLQDALNHVNSDRTAEQMLTATQFSVYCNSFVNASNIFEGRVLRTLDQNSARLEEARKKLLKLRGLYNSIVSRESHYMKIYKRKCCNLQKAEEEVDLLGDDVDNLLNLLGKVFTTLNHYAPILRHYPGISELMTIIKKEIMEHVDNDLKLCQILYK